MPLTREEHLDVWRSWPRWQSAWSVGVDGFLLRTSEGLERAQIAGSANPREARQDGFCDRPCADTAIGTRRTALQDRRRGRRINVRLDASVPLRVWCASRARLAPLDSSADICRCRIWSSCSAEQDVPAGFA